MPPRKRARVSRVTPSTPPSLHKSPTPAEDPPAEPRQAAADDPWTDEEEIGLFKGVIKYKPTGIHRHFHLLSLHQYMLENGFIHPRNEHTKLQGIWRKLETLYDLDALNDREDARQLAKISVPEEFQIKSGSDEESEAESEDENAYSESDNRIETADFSLPDVEFAVRKWERRLATAKQRKSESPALLPELNFAEEPPVEFTPSFSVEPDEIATPASRRGRPRSGTTGTRGRPGPGTSVGTRRSTRTRDDAAEGEEEEQGGNEEDEDEDEEDEGDGDEDGEEETSDRNTAATRSTRKTRTTRTGAASRAQGRTGTRGR